jgi:hypothetical protein
VNINPIRTDSQIRLEPAPKPVARRETPVADQDGFEARAQDQLMSELRQMPDARPDAVALGKKLAADPNYPSDEILGQLAEILVELPGTV